MVKDGFPTRPRVTDFSIEGILAKEDPRGDLVHQQTLGHVPERSAFSKPRHEQKSAFSAPTINIENRARAAQTITSLTSNAKAFLTTADGTSRVTGNKVLTVVDGNTPTRESTNALPQYPREMTKGTLFPCGNCKKTFTSSLYLERHQRSCNIRDGPRVKVAPEQIPTDMTSLGRVCGGRTVYYCPHCIYQTTDNPNIRRHLVTHTGEKPYKCDVCGKRFTMIGSQTIHYRLNTGEKPYKCTECSYSGNYSSGLKKHMLAKLTNERVYGCSECSYRTVYSSHMTSHTRIHTGEKPYHCPHCEYMASRKQHLTSHIDRIHMSIMLTKQ